MNSSPLRFAVLFAVGFALMMAAFEASRGTTFERVLIEDVILRPTVALINRVTPAEDAQLVGRIITSPDGANLRVVRGCEGVELFILLTAAILAFPATASQRLRGLVEGALIAYVLSVLRLMALHYVLRYSPTAWEALHGLVLPLGPILVIGIYFLNWSGRCAPPADAKPLAT